MAVAGEVSFLRRFAGKFVEIVAAGIGTAVSGYLVAHLTGYFSLSTLPTVEAMLPRAISSPAAPRNTESIETRVRAALASHDATQAAPSAAAMPQPVALASPVDQAPLASTSAPITAPPLAATEIKSVPVAAAVDPPLSPEPDGWPSNPRAVNNTRPLLPVAGSTMLPPQPPPPATGDLFSALKHFF